MIKKGEIMEIEIEKKVLFLGLGGFIILAVIGGLIYFRFFRQTSLNQPIADAALDSFQLSLNDQERTDARRIKDLEEAMSALIKQVASLKSKGSESSSADLNNLQAQITDLQNQINLLKTGQTPLASTTTTTTVAASKSAVYIPLGSGGTYNYKDWEALPAYEITLDTVDYPGYTSMQLEVIFRLTQVAEAGARLYNYTDSAAISGSDVYTKSDTFSLHTSSKFTLATGRKTYRLQVKSPDTYDVIIQNVRIKVNF